MNYLTQSLLSDLLFTLLIVDSVMKTFKDLTLKSRLSNEGAVLVTPIPEGINLEVFINSCLKDIDRECSHFDIYVHSKPKRGVAGKTQQYDVIVGTLWIF